MKRLPVWSLSLMLSVMTAPVAVAGEYAPKVGRPHPEILLPSMTDGEPVSLSQFRGRKVLLIHFASW